MQVSHTLWIEARSRVPSEGQLAFKESQWNLQKALNLEGFIYTPLQQSLENPALKFANIFQNTTGHFNMVWFYICLACVQCVYTRWVDSLEDPHPLSLTSTWLATL